ncbi:peptidase family M3 [Colletotrichum scovillei]|uniref:Peptidase family M3 n=1 Tax=Colletotrichum scovillei TaxID=1209932 RepID=A0A9P7QV89_9PEZI|nr:peptidase family M3 [Colletotrichum scovillei]KAG7042127.1 peptidase family M3 [Colletotrichum scovillei]KAG7062162.1 peptidase family M3 [Colletotrichum scovillei]
MLGERKRFDTFEDLDDLRDIKFIVGPEKIEYSVPEARFANLSPPLRALLTGGFQESRECNVIWDDTDPITFVLLAQFACRGDYSLPESKALPTKENEAPEDGDAPKNLPPSMQGYFWATEHRGSQHHFTQAILKKFTGIEAFEKACRHVEHLRPMYMHHVQLYFLADKYAIEDLKKMCLARIRHFLSECPGTLQLKTVLFESVPIIYSWTVHGDSLRRLITRYFLANMTWIDTGKRFKELRRITPEFGLDLLDEIPHSYWKELSEGPSEPAAEE